MNLKESFRYQNYLSSLFNAMTLYLRDARNLVRVSQEHLRRSANPDAQDETTDVTAERPYAYDNSTIIAFVKAVLEEKHALSIAIGKAKSAAPLDIDSETACNTMRHGIIALLASACSTKSSEKKTFGTDFKFNANGEQVPYRYDIREVTTIDFDRGAYKQLAKQLTREADEMSAALDRCMIDVEVDFEPSFNVSDSVEDALESFHQWNQYLKHAV